jgi:hypothetical protein
VIIRSAQLCTYESLAQTAFRRKVAAYLRKHLPEHTGSISNEDLDLKIVQWQARAAGHGAVAERAIAKWCFLSLAMTETFDDLPEIRDYLALPTPEASAKVDTLMDALYVRLRQAEQRST